MYILQIKLGLNLEWNSPYYFGEVMKKQTKTIQLKTTEIKTNKKSIAYKG